MPTAIINGIQLYYEEHGQGDEVFIFIHGAESSSESWNEMKWWQLLPSNYHCYALDLRNHGKSEYTQLSENLTYIQWADDVYKFSIELGLDKFVYVGYSLGGGIGFQLAADHPEMLKGLIAIAGPPQARNIPIPSPITRKMIEARLTGNPVTLRTALESHFVPTSDKLRLQRREKFLNQNIKKIMQPSNIGHLPFNPGIPFPNCKTNDELYQHLSSITVPTLMISGIQDPIFDIEHCLRVAKVISGAKAAFFQDQSHLLCMESPEIVISELELFISNLKNKNLLNN